MKSYYFRFKFRFPDGNWHQTYNVDNNDVYTFAVLIFELKALNIPDFFVSRQGGHWVKYNTVLFSPHVYGGTIEDSLTSSQL